MMIKRVNLVLLLILIPILFSTQKGYAAKHESEEKKAILLIAFGTSIPESRESISRVGENVAKAFPNTEIRWAFTSKIIRGILKKRGEAIDSPAEALAKLGEDGYTKVYIQSLHVIPGDEYNDVLKTAAAFEGIPKGIKEITVGKPLLYDESDMTEVAKVLKAHLPAERKAGDAVVFMGHGSKHIANIYYAAMQYYFGRIDPNIIMGTVEGTPTLDDVLAELKRRNAKKVWLIPFMLVAGDHALNDMAGDEPDSWKSVLTAKGYKVEPVLKGMGDYAEIGDLWVKHLKALMEN